MIWPRPVRAVVTVAERTVGPADATAALTRTTAAITPAISMFFMFWPPRSSVFVHASTEASRAWIAVEEDSYRTLNRRNASCSARGRVLRSSPVVHEQRKTVTVLFCDV